MMSPGLRDALAFQFAGSRKSIEKRPGCVWEVTDEPLPACQDRAMGKDAALAERMQKMIFLLKAAGCPLDADYDLHHYGPYSQDVARLTDEMVREKLLCETTEARPYGEQYSYVLSDEASRQISAYESSSRGAGPAKEMAACESLARKLEQTDLKELEIASTIVFFREQGDDWTAAVEKTRNFKNLLADTHFLEKCKALASEIVA